MKQKSLVGISAKLALALILTFSFARTTQSQDNKKQKKQKQDTSDNPMPMPPVPTPDQLDLNIGEMLGAWQVGDVEAMHKYYDDNVTIVAGTYEPPIIGWANYAAAYQKMHARIQEMQFVRRNTFIFNRGD